MFNGGMTDIFFMAIFAAFIAVKLYLALGRKDFDTKDQATKNPPSIQPGQKMEEKIHQFSEARTKKGAPIIDLDIEDFVDITAAEQEKYGLVLAAKIQEIRAIDPSFSPETFLSGAGKAFEIALAAFAKGDRRTLKGLLSKEVYQGFEQEIERREKSEHTQDTTLVSLNIVGIKEISVVRKTAKITVEFVSEQVNLIKDKSGALVEGNPSQIDKITDIWTFARNVTSSNPNWELVDTQEG